MTGKNNLLKDNIRLNEENKKLKAVIERMDKHYDEAEKETEVHKGAISFWQLCADTNMKKIKSLTDQLQWSIKNEAKYKTQIESLTSTISTIKADYESCASELQVYGRKVEMLTKCSGTLKQMKKNFPYCKCRECKNAQALAEMA